MTPPQSRAAAFFLLGVTLVSSLHTQAQEKRGTVIPLRVPHTGKPPSIVCNSNEDWAPVPTTTLSKKSLSPSDPGHESSQTAIFLISDPSQAAKDLPPDVTAKLDSFQAQYAFQWDSHSLYGYVHFKEKNIDKRHSSISEALLSHSGYGASLEDLLYSSVIVEVGAPSWQRWTTEMHVHVRAPDAKLPFSVFYGRTNAEEQFHKLEGKAVTCPANDGWTAKFQLTWLPYESWQPGSGATADLRLLAPLASGRKGYVLATVIPFVLTD